MLGWLYFLWTIVERATVFDWVIFVGGVCFLLYWLGTRNYNHFRLQDLPYARPIPFLGNMAGVIFGRTALFDFISSLYTQFEDHQAIGFFQCLKPALLVRDPELIKLVTNTEFAHFENHQEFMTEKIAPLMARSIINLKGQDWRDMRATLSPAFTSSKMRNIFKLMDLCGEQMGTYLGKNVKSSSGGIYETEMKDLFLRFAVQVIATGAFGIECDCIGQSENEFYRMGRELTTIKGTQGLIMLGYFINPRIIECLGLTFIRRKVREFFHDLVHDTINERQKNRIFRPDMLQLLMQAREGQLKAEAGDEQENINNAKMKKLTDLDITAQAVIFLLAGTDSVADAMSFCAHVLAHNPEVQKRVQREIDEIFEKNEGKFTYEAAQDLKYMEMFISEVLRLYTPVPVMTRMCSKDFTIPAQDKVTSYTARKGDTVWIATGPLHRDSKYWDDPETFNPERFNEENKPKIKPFTYMPFGTGPRNCLGYRFAILEMKIALAHILRNFNFMATAKTSKKLEYQIHDFTGNIKGGIWVGLSQRPR